MADKKIPDREEQLDFFQSRHDQIHFVYDQEEPEKAVPTEEPEYDTGDEADGRVRHIGKGRTAGICAGVAGVLVLVAGSFLLGRLQGQQENTAVSTEETDDPQNDALPLLAAGYDTLADWLCEQLADRGSVTLFHGNGEYLLDEIIVGDFDGDGLFPEAVRLHIGPDEQGEMTDSVNVTFWEINGSNTIQEKTISQAFIELPDGETEAEADTAAAASTYARGDQDTCRTFIDTFILNQRNAYSGLELILCGEQYYNGSGSPYSFLVHYEDGTAVNLYGAKGTPRAECRTDAGGEEKLYYDHNGIYQFFGPFSFQTELTAVYSYSCEAGMDIAWADTVHSYQMLEGAEYYLKRPVLAWADNPFYDDESMIVLTGTTVKFVSAASACYIVETDTGMRGFVEITSGVGNKGFSCVTLQNLPFREVFSTEPLTEEETTEDLYAYTAPGEIISEPGMYEMNRPYLADLDGDGLFEWIYAQSTENAGHTITVNAPKEVDEADWGEADDNTALILIRLPENPLQLYLGVMTYDKTKRYEMLDGSTVMQGSTVLYQYDEINNLSYAAMYDIPVFDPETGENIIADGSYWTKGWQEDFEVWEYVSPDEDADGKQYTEENRYEEFLLTEPVICSFRGEMILYTDLNGKTEAGPVTSDALELQKIIVDHTKDQVYGFLYSYKYGIEGYTAPIEKGNLYNALFGWG